MPVVNAPPVKGLDTADARCSPPQWPASQSHSHPFQMLFDGQMCPESLHEVVEDIFEALELLLLLGYAGLYLECDVLHVLEREAQPGQQQ